MQDSTSVVPVLSNLEKQRYGDFNTVIGAGLKTTMEVHNAFASIRDEMLYREEYPSFEDFCEKKWGVTRQRGYQMIAASDTAEALAPILEQDEVITERTTRPMKGLDPEQKREVWQKAKEITDRPTAKHIKAISDTYRPPKETVIDVKPEKTVTMICPKCDGTGRIKV